MLAKSQKSRSRHFQNTAVWLCTLSVDFLAQRNATSRVAQASSEHCPWWRSFPSISNAISTAQLFSTRN